MTPTIDFTGLVTTAAGPLLGLLLGSVVGSFLGAILVRWPQGRSVRAGRSRCDACDRVLTPRDLVPLLSYLWLGGRCRTCGAPIRAGQFAAEAGGALIGLVAFAAHPFSLALVTAIFGWWLLLIALLDLEHYWLPDRLTWPLLLAGLAAGLTGYGPSLPDRLLAAAAGFLALAGIAALYRRVRGREGLGGGDPKLLAALGGWLGYQSLPLVLVLAGMLGLAAVLLQMLRGTPVRSGDRIPLGTLMALAAWPLWLIAAG